MAALTGRTVRDSYIELLKLNTASTNTGVTGSLIDVTDGGNTASALSISTSQIASTVNGSAGTAAFTRKGDTNTGVFFPTADTIAVTTNGTERLRIDSNGFTTAGANGIGVTPTGTFNVSDLNDSSVRLWRSVSEYIQLAAARGGFNGQNNVFLFDIVGNPNLRPMKIRQSSTGGTSFTDVVTLDATGKVGIGMTPTAQLELSTDDAKKPSTNTWTIVSDQRLKTNITNADNDRCYEIVKQVPLKRYTWKSEVYSQDKVKDRSKLGWIAQDVEAVFPKAVGTNRFAYNQVFEDVVTPELDSDGNAVLDENGVAKTKTEKRLVSEEVIEDCKDLNSDQIYAAMYGTIQKLIEKVETLEAKVAALEAA